MSKALIIYHADCVDGLIAAAIWQFALEFQGHEVVAYPQQYNKETDNDIDTYVAMADYYESIIVVDFSFSEAGLKKLLEKIAYHDNCCQTQLLLQDHHKGSEWMQDYNCCQHSDNKASGAMMAYSWCGAGIRQHNPDLANILATAANLADDYDRWVKEIPESEWFHADMSTFVRTPLSEFTEFITTEGSEFITNAISRGYQRCIVYDEIAEEHVSRAEENPIACCDPKTLLPGIALEVTVRNRSIINSIAHKFLERNPGCHYVLLWYFATPGRVSCSLRADANNKRIDLNKMASEYGGGGHRTAAGMQMVPSQLFNWLDEVNVSRTIHN